MALLKTRRRDTMTRNQPKALFNCFSGSERAYRAPKRAVMRAHAARTSAARQSENPWRPYVTAPIRAVKTMAKGSCRGAGAGLAREQDHKGDHDDTAAEADKAAKGPPRQPDQETFSLTPVERFNGMRNQYTTSGRVYPSAKNRFKFQVSRFKEKTVKTVSGSRFHVSRKSP
jgi:hypothetical protein